MDLSLIQGFDRTTLEFMLEQDIPEENKVAIQAELQRRTIEQHAAVGCRWAAHFGIAAARKRYGC